MNNLFGLSVYQGSVANMLERISPELEPVVEETRQTFSEAGTLNIDETGWKCKGKRRFFGVFVSPLAVYFCIAASRGAKVRRSQRLCELPRERDAAALLDSHYPQAQGVQREQEQPQRLHLCPQHAQRSGVYLGLLACFPRRMHQQCVVLDNIGNFN
jgi:hypothetical protein